MLAVQIDPFAVTALHGHNSQKLLAYRAKILTDHTFGLVDYKYLIHWNLKNA